MLNLATLFPEGQFSAIGGCGMDLGAQIMLPVSGVKCVIDLDIRIVCSKWPSGLMGFNFLCFRPLQPLLGQHPRQGFLYTGYEGPAPFWAPDGNQTRGLQSIKLLL